MKRSRLTEPRDGTLFVDEPDESILTLPVVAGRISEFQNLHTSFVHYDVEPIYLISRATFDDGTEEISVTCQCGDCEPVAVGEPGPNGMEWSSLREEELN